MTVQTGQQLQALCQAILLGGAFGIIYDGMRVIRRCFPRKWLEVLLDLAFWLGGTGVLFVWSQSAWDGQIRWYGPLFCMVGGGCYFWGLSSWMFGLLWRLAKLIGLGWRILCWPLGQSWKLFKKFPKPSFLSGKNKV